MLIDTRWDAELDTIERSTQNLRSMMSTLTPEQRATLIARASRLGDGLQSLVIHAINTGDITQATGMPVEQTLMLDGRRTATEAYNTTTVAARLRTMPILWGLFISGVVSAPQVRAIVASIKGIGEAGRIDVDRMLGEQAPRLAEVDPQELLDKVDHVVASMAPQLQQAREQRQIEASFLVVQPKLGGGGTLYGEADTETFATVCEALDAAADVPVSPDEPGAPTRAQQRMMGLARIAESYLSGDSGGSTGGGGSTRPRPRFLATFDASQLSRLDYLEGARVLWAISGGPGRMTPLSTEVAACDAEWVKVIFDGARPVAVGDAQSTITAKQRAALVARDRGCRFPGCRAPAAWTDAHHVQYRSHAGSTCVDNLVLLCRRHHRMVHRYRWKISMDPDGSVTWDRRARRYISPPPRQPAMRT